MHGFFLREAWRSLRQHGGLALTAILSLTAALTLSAVFLLFAHNAEVAMRLVSDRREMVVYLRDDIRDSERDAVGRRLQELCGEATYVSKEQAWKEFTSQVGDPGLLEAVGGNPLPASFRIKLRPELLSFKAMDETSKQVSAIPEVEDVRFGGEWVRRLDDLTLGIRRGAVAVGLIVALAIVFVMHNTIRLTVLARRPQVEIMGRLGATNQFIATPFVFEALFQAGVAALLALAMAWIFHSAFVLQVVNISFLPITWIALFLAATIALAWLAAMLALSRVLRAVGA